MEGEKFETWLGSIIQPGEKFYLGGTSEEQLQRLIERTAAIGYEGQIEQAFVIHYGTEQTAKLDVAGFRQHQDQFTIVDVRNASEVKGKKIFENSLLIPLPEIRNRFHEIPPDKPVVVHCLGGYRSAAASSLIGTQINGGSKVFDLGESVKEFSNNHH
jgi:rhodanese-related sulfurtransferase